MTFSLSLLLPFLLLEEPEVFSFSRLISSKSNRVATAWTAFPAAVTALVACWVARLTEVSRLSKPWSWLLRALIFSLIRSVI